MSSTAPRAMLTQRGGNTNEHWAIRVCFIGCKVRTKTKNTNEISVPGLRATWHFSLESCHAVKCRATLHLTRLKAANNLNNNCCFVSTFVLLLSSSISLSKRQPGVLLWDARKQLACQALFERIIHALINDALVSVCKQPNFLQALTQSALKAVTNANAPCKKSWTDESDSC